MDLLERIDRWGRVAPHRRAQVCGSRSLTYGELLHGSDALAANLAQALPNDRSPVAIVGHKEAEMFVAFLGVIKAGHPYVPIDSSLPRQRIEQILAAAQVSLTLTPESIRHTPCADVPHTELWPVSDRDTPPTEGLRSTGDLRSAVSAGSGDPRRTQPAEAGTTNADDPFYIMFTSGSTGTPKGVVITHGCLTFFLDWMLAEQAFGEEETFLNQVPYSFDVSFMDTYTSLLTGGTVFSITRDEIANPKQLYQSLAASGVTTWVSTPSFAQMCLVERSFAAGMLPHVRRFLFCGETLAPQVATQLLDRFPGAEVWNTYGPTETTVATTSVQVDRALLARYSPLPIGYPMPGSRIVVLDEAGNCLPDGQRGEIVIAGPHVSPGYLGRPDLTERAFFMFDGQRAYRTGDEGHYQDGLLFFDGRMDSQIKLHGYRIELGDVEANLQALPGVRDAVVVAVVKQGQAESLAAFVILDEQRIRHTPCAVGERPASDFEIAQALRRQLGERLPAYMVPRKFCFLEVFPMTANGKADRRKLAEGLK